MYIETADLIMQRAAGSSVSFLAGAQCTEVLGSPWCSVSVQLHGDPSGAAAPDRYVKKHLRVGHLDVVCNGSML
jgi:hypothetical protein